MVIKDLEGKGYNFAVSPYVGYFFRNNISAGVRFAYHRDYLDLGNVDANLGDITISFKDLYYLEHKYETSGFCVLIFLLGVVRYSDCLMRLA